MNPNQLREILPLISLIQIIWGGFVCFYGYRLFKVVLGFIGFAFGFAITAAIVGAISNDAGAALALGFIGGILGAAVTLAVYFLGVFLIGASIGSTIGLVMVAATKSDEMFILVILLAIAGGVIALFLQKLMIVVSTAFTGAFGIVTGFALFSKGGTSLGFDSIKLLSRFDSGEMSAVVFIWLAVGAVGVAVQYQLLARALASGRSMGKVGWDPRKTKSISDQQLKSVIAAIKEQSASHVHSGANVSAVGPSVRGEQLTCARCGHVIYPGSKFCDNCGNALVASCSKCGRQLEANTRYCPECGAATEDQGTSPVEKSASTKIATANRLCPSCGRSVPADGKFCDVCGQPLTILCTECGEKLDADTSFCPRCGKSRSESALPTGSSAADLISSTGPVDSQEIKKPIVYKKGIASHKVVAAEECPHCGHGNQKGARFCESCGKSLYEVCPQCGSELKSKTVYCSFCGTNIELYNSSLEYEARARESLSAQSYDNAIEELTLALQQRPDNPELRELLEQAQKKHEILNSTLSNAKAAYEEGSFEDAEQLFKEAQELMHNPGEADEVLASIPEKIEERDFERFQEQYDKALESDNPDKALSLAKSNADRFGHQVLDEYITKAEERYTEQQIVRNLKSAEEAFADGDYDFALTRASFVLDKQPNHVRALELKTRSEDASAAKRRKTIRIAGIVIACVAIIVVAVVLFNSWRAAQREKDKYLEARSSLMPQLYLTEYPRGKYSSEMRQFQDSLIDVHFGKISQSSNLDSLRGFLQAYPNSQHTVTVQRRITSLEDSNKETKAWQRAQNANTSASYKEYLDRYPTGKHSEAAYNRYKDLLVKGR